jgi:AcrR family transcriptional regulator
MPRDDIRLKLLDAALEILLCKGIQAFTQTRVAERAGVRQSHLTYYFPTRSDLLKAVVESGSQVVLETMGVSSALLPSSLDDFRQAMAEHVSGTRMPRLMMALSVASDEDPSLKLWMAEFESRIQESMRLALLHYGLTLDANELALFHATVVGISVLNVNASTEESSQQAGRMFMMAFDRLLESRVAVTCREDHKKIASRKVINRSRIKKAVKVEGEV